MLLKMKRMKTSNKEYCNSFKGVPILIDCFQVDMNMRSKCSTLPFLCCRHSVRHCRTPSRNHQSRRPWSCLLGPHSSDASCFCRCPQRHQDKCACWENTWKKFLNGWSMGVWYLRVCVCVCVDTICFGKMCLGILRHTAACCLVNDAFLLKRWYHLRRTDLCRYKAGQGNHGKCWFSDRSNLWHENLGSIQNMYELILCLSFEHHDLVYWNFAVHCHSVQGKWFLWHFLIQWIPWNRWMRLWHKRCRILCRWWVKRMENQKRTLAHVCFRFITLYFLAFSVANQRTKTLKALEMLRSKVCEGL